MAKAEVWSKETCGYCTLAIAELRSRNYDVTVKKIIEPTTPSEEKESLFTKEDLLKVVPNARSVPQIFIEDKHIGGYTELMKHFASA
tara:strand:+ start:2842 stop:3102 length:261 start_codon:yes stop_codon:yes gene_type:complete